MRIQLNVKRCWKHSLSTVKPHGLFMDKGRCWPQFPIFPTLMLSPPKDSPHWLVNGMATKITEAKVSYSLCSFSWGCLSLGPLEHTELLLTATGACCGLHKFNFSMRLLQNLQAKPLNIKREVIRYLLNYINHICDPVLNPDCTRIHINPINISRYQLTALQI